MKVEIIVDQMPEIRRMETDPLLLPKFKVEAMVLTPLVGHRDFIVVVDERILTQRDPAPYHMALAEEISHIELHRSVLLDIHEPDDFAELQRHPRWWIAERDAKNLARAILMPSAMLEAVAGKLYASIAHDIGFGDSYQFSKQFALRMSRAFQVPRPDAERRIDSYIGDLRTRLERSIAARSNNLMRIHDDVGVRAWSQSALPFALDEA